ncbi:MAG: YbaN family protein [Bacteroidales bacterium]|nr:YbaN family protein [Bacteroidales bacterium]
MTQTKRYNSPLVRYLLIFMGSISVGLAVLGIVLPVLPTTPFLLFAAWCYARSSTRFYVWLMTHRLWGKYLRDYTSGRGVPVKVKVYAIVLLWITILSSVIFAIDKLWLQILLIAIALGVSIHILRIRTLRQGK